MPGFVDVTGWSKRDIQRLGHEDDDYEEPARPKYKPPQQQNTFTAEQVWACAAAAQRINGAYLKEDQWACTGVDQAKFQRLSNKNMVKKWLRENDFVDLIEEDYAAGRSYRDHFKGYTLLAIAGKLNDFQKSAYKVAVKEEFTGRDMYDFSVISCLPSVASRELTKAEIRRGILETGEQLQGAVGDTIQGDITVMGSWYSKEYNRYKIQARMGESFVDFWFGEDLSGERRIKAKIKQHRDDLTTQLNYVKLL
jgi:hypothetical protein